MVIQQTPPGRGRIMVLGGLCFALAASAILSGVQTAPVQAQEKVKLGDTVVTSKEIDFDFAKNRHVFTGSVELVSKESRMTADKMTVQMTGERELESALCEGNVSIEKKGVDPQTGMKGRAQKLDYSEKNQKATLEGDVQVEQDSPRLAKPALITGSRIDMDLKNGVNVVTRSPATQAKVHVESKGTEGKPAPEPADLVADRIEMNSRTQEYVATGKPAMVRPSSRLQAKTIRFNVDEQTNSVKTAYGDGDVVYQARDEKGAITQARGDKGSYTAEINELVLEGMVHATVKQPEDDQPTVYQGDKLVLNTRTNSGKLTQGTIVVPSKPKPKTTDAGAPATAAAGGAAGEKPKK